MGACCVGNGRGTRPTTQIYIYTVWRQYTLYLCVLNANISMSVKIVCLIKFQIFHFIFALSGKLLEPIENYKCKTLTLRYSCNCVACATFTGYGKRKCNWPPFCPVIKCNGSPVRQHVTMRSPITPSTMAGWGGAETTLPSSPLHSSPCPI